MQWENYRDIFLNYQQSESQTRLISLMAENIFKNFPQNLPEKIGKIHNEAVSDLFAVLQNQKNEVDSQQPDNNNEKIYRICFADLKRVQVNGNGEISYLRGEYARCILELFSCSLGREETDFKKTLNMERLLSSQSLVMHFSNFEGILADSFRAVCSARPEVMKKGRTIQIDKVLSTNSWSSLIAMIAETFVRELGYQSLEERVDTFNSFLGLKINLSDYEKGVLKKLDLTRNLIVHNAGKVNNEFLKFSDSDNLKIGDYIPLSNEYLKNTSWTLQFIASEIYLQISIKHFGKKENEVDRCIIRRAKL